jgi:hypothetical protein
MKDKQNKKESILEYNAEALRSSSPKKEYSIVSKEKDEQSVRGGGRIGRV